MHAQETPISSWPSHQLSGGSRHRSIWSMIKGGKMSSCACKFGVVAAALGKSSLNCNAEAGM